MLSLRKKFVNLIKEGKKTWEYRKVIPKQEVSGIVFYCPETKKIELVATNVEKKFGHKDMIINSCIDNTKIKESLGRYFANTDQAVAFKLGKIKVIEESITELYEKKTGVKIRGPQGFVYINNKDPLWDLLKLSSI